MGATEGRERQAPPLQLVACGGGDERDNRVFLTVADRNAARLWRTDVRRAGGLRGWWERWVLGPSPHGLGGKLDD